MQKLLDLLHITQYTMEHASDMMSHMILHIHFFIWKMILSIAIG